MHHAIHRAKDEGKWDQGDQKPREDQGYDDERHEQLGELAEECLDPYWQSHVNWQEQTKKKKS